MMHGWIASTLMLGVGFGLVAADGPCQSGLRPGDKIQPYVMLVTTGPNRGQSHCFVCETGDKPAVVLFAREPGETLGKLLGKLDGEMAKHKKAGLSVWASFLNENQPVFESKLAPWARRHGLAHLPVGIYEDKEGPPAYRLSRDADVTILLYANQKVVANFAFRAGELTEERTKEVLTAVQKLTKPS